MTEPIPISEMHPGMIVYMMIWNLEEFEDLDEEPEPDTAAVVIKCDDGKLHYVYLRNVQVNKDDYVHAPPMLDAGVMDLAYRTQGDALRASIENDLKYHRAQIEMIRKARKWLKKEVNAPSSEGVGLEPPEPFEDPEGGKEE